MGNILRFSINITMEAMMMIILIVLLLTCIWQKKRFLTTRPLIYLTSAVIVMLAEQIVKWSMLIYSIPVICGKLPMQIIYIVDYCLTFSVGGVFFSMQRHL